MRLADLTLADAFFQVNLVKGYRYLDTAGRIMNDFDDRFKEMEVGLQGLNMRAPADPEDHLLEMRISAEQIWLHYGVGTPWTELRQEIPRLVERIAGVLEVSSFKRRGFRTMLLYPVEDLRTGNELMRRGIYNEQVIRWDRFGETLSTAFHTRFQLKRLRVTLEMRPVRALRERPLEGFVEEQDLVVPGAMVDKIPPFAILVDTDVYSDIRAADLSVKPILNEATQFLEDEAVSLLSRLVGGERQ
jgi:hypothetical protein